MDVHATPWNVAKRYVRQEQLGAARHVHGAEDLVETIKMSADGAVELVIADDQHPSARTPPTASSAGR